MASIPLRLANILVGDGAGPTERSRYRNTLACIRGRAPLCIGKAPTRACGGTATPKMPCRSSPARPDSRTPPATASRAGADGATAKVSGSEVDGNRRGMTECGKVRCRLAGQYRCIVFRTPVATSDTRPHVIYSPRGVRSLAIPNLTDRDVPVCNYKCAAFSDSEGDFTATNGNKPQPKKQCTRRLPQRPGPQIRARLAHGRGGGRAGQRARRSHPRAAAKRGCRACQIGGSHVGSRRPEAPSRPSPATRASHGLRDHRRVARHGSLPGSDR